MRVIQKYIVFVEAEVKDDHWDVEHEVTEQEPSKTLAELIEETI